MSFRHCGDNLLCVWPLLAHERDAGQRDLQARPNPVFRQVTFDAIALLTVRVQHENRRRPNRIEALKPGRMFFDVGFERDEGPVDEVSSFLIAVGLGLQPSTSASGRGSREIDEQRLVFRFSALERLVHVFDPIDEHTSPQFEITVIEGGGGLIMNHDPRLGKVDHEATHKSYRSHKSHRSHRSSHH
jgi:hypothetical protein